MTEESGKFVLVKIWPHRRLYRVLELFDTEYFAFRDAQNNNIGTFTVLKDYELNMPQLRFDVYMTGRATYTFGVTDTMTGRYIRMPLISEVGTRTLGNMNRISQDVSDDENTSDYGDSTESDTMTVSGADDADDSANNQNKDQH